MLHNGAKWYNFSPPRWSFIAPPLTPQECAGFRCKSPGHLHTPIRRLLLGSWGACRLRSRPPLSVCWAGGSDWRWIRALGWRGDRDGCMWPLRRQVRRLQCLILRDGAVVRIFAHASSRVKRGRDLIKEPTQERNFNASSNPVICVDIPYTSEALYIPHHQDASVRASPA